MRGVFSAFYEYNWQGAEEHFSKAIEYDATSPTVRLGRTLWFLVPTQRLAELWVLYTMNERKRSIRMWTLVQLFPAFPICRFASGLAFLRGGLIEEAVITSEEGRKIVPSDMFLLGVLALARAHQGRVADAEHIRAD